jgi:hypothetical protein
MKKRTGRSLPKARKEGLVIHELPDEVLVMDTGENKAHCLNDFASRVWKRCDGRTTVKEMTLLLGKDSQKELSEEAVWLALDRLAKGGLLMKPLPLPGELNQLSRREAVRKFGLAAGVAMITSIVVPTEAMAASCVVSCMHVCDGTGHPFPQLGQRCKGCTKTCTALPGFSCATWVPGTPQKGVCI